LIALLLYVFVIQFFLPQMETYFFSESLGISAGQTSSIVIAGFVMVAATGVVGLKLAEKLGVEKTTMPFAFETAGWRRMIGPIVLMGGIAYPLLYELFGYYVAWQNEHLRQFYSQSSELRPLFTQFGSFFSEGIYFFQVLRGIIWVIISIPVVMMVGGNRILRYIMMGLLSALPAIQLFIPNPYMPMDIAMSHFIETSTSNFLWGMLIAFVIDRLAGDGNIIVTGARQATQM
jgi:hypothetical protein